MSNVENIFNLDDLYEISNNRANEDILKIAPVSGSDLNKASELRFEINNAQHYLCLYDAYFVCDFKITKDDGTDLANDDITLENNWLARCFEQMILRIGGTPVESLNHSVGEVSTMLNFIMKPPSTKRETGLLTGWAPDTSNGDNDVADVDYNAGYYYRKKCYNKKKTGSCVFPLKPLFGFCDYNKILYLIKISISLFRKSDSILHEDIFYGAAATKAKLTFERLELHVPYIEPSLQVEEIITKRLNTHKPIDVVFLKRNCSSITIPTGGTYSWSLGTYANSVRFVFVCFKKVGGPSFQANNALTTEHDAAGNQITALRLQLNSSYHPIDYMRINFAEFKFTDAYKAYVDVCKTFGNEPSLSYVEYHDLFPMFAFDVSSQAEQLKTNGITVTLHIEKASALTLEAHCVLLEDAHYSIESNDGKMIRLN